jgi:hypothetical protein
VLSDEFKGIEVDQDEEGLFKDALERITSMQFVQSPAEAARMSRRLERLVDEVLEDDEPLERESLPWLKDPSAKLSIWTVLKDSIGSGDISKISVPVYFNAPNSLLQNCA